MKPDAETIIARFLKRHEGIVWNRRGSDDIRAQYRADAQALLNELRANGYSLIYGADHKFVPQTVATPAVEPEAPAEVARPTSKGRSVNRPGHDSRTGAQPNRSRGD